MSANLQPTKQGGMAAPQEHATPSDTKTRSAGDGGGKGHESRPTKEGFQKPTGGRRGNGNLH